MKKSVNFFPSTSSRLVANTAPITLKNRYAEQNPILNDGPVSLLARPSLKKFAEVGTGHIRKLFAPPGLFDEALWVVSGLKLHKVLVDGTVSEIGTISTSVTGSVSFAATAPIGEVPSYLFVAEGGILWVYTENSQASGHLSVTGAIANNETIVVDGIYFKWTSGSVDTGTPAGTAGSPWLVALGLTDAASLSNMYEAINASGTPGTTHSTLLDATTKPTTFFAGSVDATNLYVIASVAGTGGNAITTTETMTNGSWGGATMASGGTAGIRQVQVPDDVGAVSIAHINSYVIVVPVQTDATRGRFYWINPGDTFIDPLSFATAERSPDGIFQVIVFGDYFWLLGQDTTEPWVTTTNTEAPMERFHGILYDRGTLSGTGIQVKDSMIVIDQDGGVFQNGEGSKRISTPDIEEKIRRAMQKASLIASFS